MSCPGGVPEVAAPRLGSPTFSLGPVSGCRELLQDVQKPVVPVNHAGALPEALRMSRELMKLDLSAHSKPDDVQVSIRPSSAAVIAGKTFMDRMSSAQRCGKG